MRAWLGIFLLLMTELVGAIAAPLPRLSEESFYVSYAERPQLTQILAHDWSILSADAEFDRNRIHLAGRKVIGYLSVGEVARNARYLKRVKALKIPFLDLNAEWNSDAVDLSSPLWRKFVVEELAPALVSKGFDGFFLDTMDTVEGMAEKYPERAKTMRQGLEELVRSLKERYPRHYLIANRGFALVEKSPELFDAMLVESLYGTYDFKSKTYGEISAEGSAWLLDRMNRIKKQGTPVFVLDYASPRETQKAQALAKKIRDQRFCPLVTPVDLMGEELAPLLPVKRRILCLYGSTGTSSEAVKHPIDTRTSLVLQMPLEWMGYEITYRNLATGPFPEALSAGYKAIILEPTLKIAPALQKKAAEWIVEEVRHGMKLILFQQIPFNDSEARKILSQELGMIFGADTIEARPVRFSIQSPLIGFEEGAHPSRMAYPRIKAPDGAEIHLQAEFLSALKAPWTSDLIFTSNWGGVALNPCTIYRRPDGIDLWVVNPWEFLEKALGPVPAFPVPDATTRDGVRLFYTQVDADGFSDRSQVEKGARSAGIIRDHIFKKYPFPVAASIIGLEIIGEMKGQNKKEAPELETLARSIFELPNVEAASHTWTHPFVWLENDRTAGAYESQSIAKDQVGFGKTVLSKEINGSLEMIQQKLLPPKKEVKLFLWSGNCRPGEEALRLVRQAGALSLNGGFTDISTLKPSLTAVSPRGVPWGEEYQVFNAVQNDNIYTDGWHGPHYGGYSRVINTFERTEVPRRLKPVGVYYHFFSGDRWDSLLALKEIFEWVSSQSLHAIWPSQFAAIVLDAKDCEIYELGPNRWRLVTQGALKTFRLPKSALLPDLATSSGIVGYRIERDWIYVHTVGAPVCDLVLSKHPSSRLFLESSTAETEFEVFEADRVRLKVQDFREARLVFAGMTPGLKMVYRIGSKETQEIRADREGRLEILIPAGAVVLELCKAP